LKIRVSNNQHQTPVGEEIVTRVKGNFVMMSIITKKVKEKKKFIQCISGDVKRIPCTHTTLKILTHTYYKALTLCTI
jgi:hypothetical protein